MAQEDYTSVSADISSSNLIDEASQLDDQWQLELEAGDALRQFQQMEDIGDNESPHSPEQGRHGDNTEIEISQEGYTSKSGDISLTDLMIFGPHDRHGDNTESAILDHDRNAADFTLGTQVPQGMEVAKMSGDITEPAILDDERNAALLMLSREHIIAPIS